MSTTQTINDLATLSILSMKVILSLRLARTPGILPTT
nr:MAG TPA: hypothetical protein [Caudoviricetes sp.]